jgi:hypothetical protein
VVETLVVEEILSKLVYHKVVTLEEILVVAVELTLVDPQTQLQEQDKALVDLVMVKDQDKVLDKV